MFAAVFCLLLVLGPPSGEEAWSEFSTWFRAEGIPGSPDQVMKAYSAKLASQGVAEEDVKGRAAAIQAYMASHKMEALALHFDRIFLWKEAPFVKEPSQLVVKIANTLKPGRALDVAMGQGRNAIWLAKQGWDVSGYDLSGEAIRQAQSGASAAGVTLKTQQCSHDEYDYGQAQWDLIVMSFAFTAMNDQAFMQKVHDSLKPGGVLLVEGFNGPPGGKRAEANLMLKGILQYRVLLYEDLPDTADWGKVKAPLFRMAVEKQ